MAASENGSQKWAGQQRISAKPGRRPPEPWRARCVPDRAVNPAHFGVIVRIAADLTGQAAECRDGMVAVSCGVLVDQRGRVLECPSRAINSLRLAPAAAARVLPVALQLVLSRTKIM